MIGTTMTASTIAAVKIVLPVAETSPPKSGNQPMFRRARRRPGHGRGEHHDAPEAEDDRGDRGQQVDDVAEALGETARGVVRDEQRDAQASGHAISSASAAAMSVPKSSGQM